MHDFYIYLIELKRAYKWPLPLRVHLKNFPAQLLPLDGWPSDCIPVGAKEIR
jgi:hypothetical protein